MSEETKTHLVEWLSRTLNNRANQEWTPVIKAGPLTTLAYAGIEGYTIVPDKALNEGMVVVTNEKEFVLKSGENETTIPAGSILAQISGLPF